MLHARYSGMTHDDMASSPATKSDLAELATDLRTQMATKSDLAELAADVRTQMATKSDLAALAADVRTQMGEVRTDVRALGVVVEQTNANVQLLAEALTGVRTELKADIAALREELSVRIARLEDAVRAHATEIKGMRSDIAGLRNDVASLRRDFERRDAERLTAIEARVTELEKRTGIA